MDWNSILDKSKIPRDNNKIKKLVLLLKVKRNEKQLIELFTCLSDIIVKQINNLFFLIRFEEVKFIEHSECISESFIVFERCIKAFKLSNDNDFVVFYNVSLLRHFVRLKNKAYRFNNKNQKIRTDCYDNESFSNLFDAKSDDKQINLMINDLYSMGLNLNELRLLTSKFLLGEKKKDFMKNNEDFNENLYQKTFSDLKEKIKEYYAV